MSGIPASSLAMKGYSFLLCQGFDVKLGTYLDTGLCNGLSQSPLATALLNNFLASSSLLMKISARPNWSTMKRLFGRRIIALRYSSTFSGSVSFSSFLLMLKVCSAAVSLCIALSSSTSISCTVALLFPADISEPPLREIPGENASDDFSKSNLNGSQSMKKPASTLSLPCTLVQSAASCFTIKGWSWE